MRNVFKISTFLVFFVLAPNAFAASFDCSKASTVTEKTICSTDELSSLDELMFAVYKQALRSNDWMYFEEDRDDSALIASQRNAITLQLKCGSSVKCLKDFYSERTQELLQISGVDTGNYAGNPVFGLLKLKAEIPLNIDLLAFASSPDAEVEVLLYASSDPANISRANTGMVYNSNPASLHVRYIKDGAVKTQNLSVPDVLSMETSLTASVTSIELFETHTRGWSTITYEYSWYDDWKLAFEESSEVTRPGPGLVHYGKVDHNIGVSYSRYSYVFLNCGITDYPELIGNLN